MAGEMLVVGMRGLDRRDAPTAHGEPTPFSDRLLNSRTLLPVAALVAIGAPLLAVGGVGRVANISGYLPTAAVDLGSSFVRMLIAYSFSLVFSLAYGYFAATSRTGERILIPVLDILQSVPILGFFPVAILFFINAFPPASPIGPNLAAIFLIFTSMAWNMVFGVYESLKSLPVDLKEAADSFGKRGIQRLRQVLLPATVNRLVYNSVLSWTAGWYFLVAAEIISPRLNGIGSFLLFQAFNNNVDALLAGLLLLVALIIALDTLVWRPLGRWAEKYRYDVTPSGESEIIARRRFGLPIRRAAGYVARGVVRGVRTGVTRMSTPFVSLASYTVRGRSRRSGGRELGRYLSLGAVLVVVWLLLIYIGVHVYGVVTGPVSPVVAHQLRELPLALVYSLTRVVAAYAISLGIAFGLAIYLVRRPRAYRLGLPVVEVVASVPATALFPLFIVALGKTPYFGFQGAAILVLITGMLWYLFFNILSGLRGIPPDLEEAARSYGLPRRDYYRKLVFPAIIPALITGSITAFGGGWNTLVLAEYIQSSNGQSYQVLGLGDLLNIGNAEHTSGYPLLAGALFTLVFAVILLNELLWKPLYRRAVDKYRYE